VEPLGGRANMYQLADAPLRGPLPSGFRLSGFGLVIWDLGFGVWGLGFGVWGLGFGVWGLREKVLGIGFRVWCLVFRVWRFEFGVSCLGSGVLCHQTWCSACCVACFRFLAIVNGRV